MMPVKILEEGHDGLDLLPEYCHYEDQGCELAVSCLNCPFPQCITEDLGGKQHWLKGLRDKAVIKAYIEGQGVKEIAVAFGISLRTVQRILKRGKNE